MTTLALTINHQCTGCGECEKILPGIRGEINKRGSAFINLCNINVDVDAIQAAINNCEAGALSLDAV
jgi:Fe-S-cluster-containing hydrogenase component 2